MDRRGALGVLAGAAVAAVVPVPPREKKYSYTLTAEYLKPAAPKTYDVTILPGKTYILMDGIQYDTTHWPTIRPLRREKV